MKIKAYTLLEVTITMLIAAVCITICLTAFGIIERYYKDFQLKNEELDQVLVISRVMEKDINSCDYLTITDDGFKAVGDGSVIIYNIAPSFIVRHLSGLRRDSFFLNSDSVHFSFEGKQRSIGDTIDRVELQIIMKKGTAISVRKNKFYSSKDLYK